MTFRSSHKSLSMFPRSASVFKMLLAVSASTFIRASRYFPLAASERS